MPLSDFLRRQPKPTPKADPKPRGGSGRGHTDGFLELEELNDELRHPQSHAVFDRMYRTDADTRQVVQLSINPILGGTWDVEPYGGQEATEEDIEVAAAVKWALFDYMRPNLIGHLAQFLPVLFRSGFVPGEKVWATAVGPNGKTFLVPKTVSLMLPRSVWRWHSSGVELDAIEQFLPAGSSASVFTETSGGYLGGGGTGVGSVTIPRKDLVYYRVGAEGDNWEGVSLLRPAYKHWYLKDKIERIDAIAQEHEAMGIPVVYPPPGATSAQLDAIEEILANMRSNEQAYVLMPGMKAGAGAADGTGWLLEILGFGKDGGGGSGRDAMPTLNYHTNKIAAAFISEFMRLGHGESGARATAQVQADPFQMSIEALVTVIEQELQDSLVIPFCAYNFADLKNPPRLRMSLVDQTSLSQLADFVLKLTQVGALLPDQELEEFLRARADMPAPNPESVRKRGEDEEMIRRMIVGGNILPTPADEIAAEQAEKMAALAPAPGAPGAVPKKPSNNADPYGSNAKVGKHKNGKPAGSPLKRSGSPKGPGAGGARTPRGPGKELSEAPVRPSLHETSRWWELSVDLDALELAMDEMPARMLSACQDEVMYLAGEMCADGTPLGHPLSGERRDQTRARLLDALTAAYDEGAEHVLGEFRAQGFEPGEKLLDRGARDRGGALLDRATLAAERIELSMREAMLGQDLAHGDVARAKERAEQAGIKALQRVGYDHGVSAFLHGRHDFGMTLAGEAGGAVKVRYSAVLDRGTCPECEASDDGVARELDDPVRLRRQPPNPDCHSLASGQNRCRCIEVFEFDDGQTVSFMDLSEQAVLPQMPEYLLRILNVLVGRGMPELRAFGVAVKVARQVAATGDVRWPGLRNVGAGSQDEAREAVAWVESITEDW